MNKVPVPVAIGVCVAAIALLAFVLFRTFGRAGDSGDAKVLANEIIQNNPKGELPPGANPTAGAMMRGAKKGQ